MYKDNVSVVKAEISRLANSLNVDQSWINVELKEQGYGSISDLSKKGDEYRKAVYNDLTVNRRISLIESKKTHKSSWRQDCVRLTNDLKKRKLSHNYANESNIKKAVAIGVAGALVGAGMTTIAIDYADNGKLDGSVFHTNNDNNIISDMNSIVKNNHDNCNTVPIYENGTGIDFYVHGNNVVSVHQMKFDFPNYFKDSMTIEYTKYQNNSNTNRSDDILITIPVTKGFVQNESNVFEVLKSLGLEDKSMIQDKLNISEKDTNKTYNIIRFGNTSDTESNYNDGYALVDTHDNRETLIIKFWAGEDIPTLDKLIGMKYKINE